MATADDLDRRWLRHAVTLAVENVAEGGGPFGAVVARGGELLAAGQNRVTRSNDPTAHAEVEALRAAGQAIEDFDLAGCVLYASCEPCPMCVAAAMWARVDRVVHAADRRDAARAGFDDQVFHDLVGRDPDHWPMRVVELRLPEAATPFEAWQAHEGRRPY